jgi:hypothetical protein
MVQHVPLPVTRTQSDKKTRSANLSPPKIPGGLRHQEESE